MPPHRYPEMRDQALSQGVDRSLFEGSIDPSMGRKSGAALALLGGARGNCVIFRDGVDDLWHVHIPINRFMGRGSFEITLEYTSSTAKQDKGGGVFSKIQFDRRAWVLDSYDSAPPNIVSAPTVAIDPPDVALGKLLHSVTTNAVELPDVGVLGVRLTRDGDHANDNHTGDLAIAHVHWAFSPVRS